MSPVPQSTHESAAPAQKRDRRKLFSWIWLTVGAVLLSYVGFEYASMHFEQRSLTSQWERQNRTAATVSYPAPAAPDELTRLSIPKIGLDAVIVEGTSHRQLTIAPGHVKGTSTPGEEGNAVISAHRDTFFRHIYELQKGDGIVLGAGIIGLSLALELKRSGLSVLILEKAEPGREASYAAAGMLAPWGGDLPPSLQPLAEASAKLYPDFVLEIEDASGMKADLRSEGTILILSPEHDKTLPLPSGATPLGADELGRIEPSLKSERRALLLDESSVDPRALLAAALKAALHHGIEVASGAHVLEIGRAH